MSAMLPPGVERILFTEEQIENRIGEVAAEISRRYEGKPLKLIGVLKGSVFFLTALSRRIEIPHKIDFLAISSFSNKSGAPGVVRIVANNPSPFTFKGTNTYIVGTGSDVALIDPGPDDEGHLRAVLVTHIREYQLSHGVPRAQVYSITMYILAGLLAVGFICNWLVRPVDQKHHMKAEEGAALAASAPHSRPDRDSAGSGPAHRRPVP